MPAPAVDPAGATLLQRARHMAANSAPIAAAVDAWAARAIGSGITPTPQPPDRDAAALIAERWARWADRCDLESIGDFYAMQARAFREIVIAGNSLVETVVDAGELHLRTRSIDQLAVTMTRNLASGYVDRGIEFDGVGRKVAFHLYRDGLSFQTVRVPADQLLHVYRALVPGMTFGTSWLAPILLPARELDLLTDSLVVGAKVAACHAGYYIDMNVAGGPVPYDGTTTNGLMNASLEPGVMRVLPSGVDVKFNNPQQSNSALDLARMSLKNIASGLSLPHWLVDNDTASISYSSARICLLDFKKKCEMVQFHTVIPMMLDPIYRRWLALEIATGRIDIPASNAWFKVAWLPPAFEMVDPEKDMKAEILAIGAGLKSRRQAVAERGYSVEQLDAEIAADQAREAQYDLTFGTKTNGTIDAAG